MAASLSLSITQLSQDVLANTSRVRVTVSISWTYGSYSAVAQTGSVTIDGATTSFSSTYNAGRSTTGSQVLKTVETNVAHTSDGTKLLYASASYRTGGSSGTVSASRSLQLTPIPRATTPVLSVDTSPMGATVSITLDRAVDTFTHTLSYAFGSLTDQTAGLSATTAVGTSATFTPPTSLASQVPAAAAGPCTITCTTYDGENLIGTRSVTLTLEVPSSVVPVISSVSITEATTRLADQFHAYVQNKSTLAVSITAAGASGSTIVSTRTVVQGVTYTGASFTTAVLTASGSSQISVTVTDTRGRTATQQISLTVLEYFPPRLSSMSASRINTSGVLDDEGPRVGIAAVFALAPVGNHNVHTYTAQYKKSGDEAWTTFDTGAASWTYDGLKAYTEAPFIDPDYPYAIRLILTDYFGSVQADSEIPTAYSLVDWRDSGRGIAFGKVSEKDLMEVAMDMEVTGAASFGALEINGDLTREGSPLVLPLANGGTGASTAEAAREALGISQDADRVEAEGTSGIWTWRKWASGLAECWGRTTKTSAVVRSWGPTTSNLLYLTGNSANVTISTEQVAYPFEFVEEPSVYPAIYQNSNYTFGIFLSNVGSASICPGYNLWRATSVSSQLTWGINMYVRGRWK